MMRLTSPARHSGPGTARPGGPESHGHRGGGKPPRSTRRRRFTAGRRIGVLLSVLGVAAGCLLLSAGAAFAYWETTDSSNPAVAAAGSLSAPTGGAATGTATSSAVPISWGAPTGYTPTGYTVLRCSGPSCTPTTPIANGGCSGLIGATSCTDTDPALAAGNNYTYAVTATLDNWVSPAGTPFTAATTGASQLAFTVQPAAGAKIQAGTGTFPVSVAIKDGNGTTLSNDNTDTVTLALNKSNGATLNCTGGLTATVSSGVASFTGCTINQAARNYQLVVTSSVTPALASPANADSFDVVAGPASQLVFTTPALTGPASSGANLGPVTVQEEDASGNPVNAGSGGVSVSLSANPSSGAVFSGSAGGTLVTSVTIPAGSAAASFYVGDSNNGSPVVTASATGLTSATQTETIQAVQLKITSNPVSGPASSTATIGPIKVKLQLADGTPVTSGTTVNLSSDSKGTFEFSATSGGTATSSLTIPAGSSQATFYYGDQLAGKPTITVSAGGLSDTQKVTVTPAAAVGLVFSGVTDGNANKTNSPTVNCTGPASSTSCTVSTEAQKGTGRFLSGQVGLVDQFGNAVTNSGGSPITVTLTQTGGTSVTSPVMIANGSSSSGTFTESLPDATGSATPIQGTVTATTTVGSASLSAAITS
jgi:hypothetical protein